MDGYGRASVRPRLLRVAAPSCSNAPTAAHSPLGKRSAFPTAPWKSHETGIPTARRPRRRRATQYTSTRTKGGPVRTRSRTLSSQNDHPRRFAPMAVHLRPEQLSIFTGMRTSSVASLPDWFPIEGGRSPALLVRDITWRVDAPLHCEESQTRTLSALLFRLDGILLARIKRVHELDHSATCGLLDEWRRASKRQSKLAEFLEQAHV